MMQRARSGPMKRGRRFTRVGPRGDVRPGTHCVEDGSGFLVPGSWLASRFRVRSRFLVHGFRFQVPGFVRSPSLQSTCDEPGTRNQGTRNR